MVKIWSTLLVTLLLLFLGAQSIDYTCPEQCRCAYLPNSYTRVQLVCFVNKLTPETFNFSLIQPSYTTWLTIGCENPFLPGRMPETPFQNLSFLTELLLSQCNILHYKKDTFQGVENRLLSLIIEKSGGFEVSVGPVFEEGLFDGLHNLQKLGLAMNNLNERSLSEKAFCGLDKLMFLNLSKNILPSQESLGLSCLDHVPILPNLLVLDISYNPLKNLTTPLAHYNPGLYSFMAQSCQLSNLEAFIFENLTHLEILDLGHNMLHVLPSEMFIELPKLRMLIMKFNRLGTIPNSLGHLFNIELLLMDGNDISTLGDCSAFANKTQLGILEFGSNKISYIPDHCFQDCSKMTSLNLQNNSLRTLNDKTFIGLNNLTALRLGQNKITSISGNAFSPLSSLIGLELNHNNLQYIPRTLSSLNKLETLDLKMNHIYTLETYILKGMSNLQGLRLSENQITYIPKAAFRDVSNLLVLNLMNNKISLLEYNAFDGLNKLEYLQLENNLLTDIALTFHTLPKLKHLTAAYNNLTMLDAFTLPPNTVSVNLSHNHITKLTGTPFQFLDYLESVDLTWNNITNLEPNDIVYSKTKLPPRPLIFLENNPLICNCSLDWLPQVNSVNLGTHYPIIGDLSFLSCEKKLLGGGVEKILFTEITKADFICEEKEIYHWSSCDCSSANICFCRMFFCPDECTCYRSSDYSFIAADCTGINATQLPEKIHNNHDNTLCPTHLLLGSNYLKIPSKAFELMVNLTSLDLSDNGLTSIAPHTFQGLNHLTTLNLSRNMFEFLIPDMLLHLDNLQILDLHGNKLINIDPTMFFTFWNLKSLDIHNNMLSTIESNVMSNWTNLKQLTLAENHWLCDCGFGEDFQRWLTENAQIVKDVRHVKCSNLTEYVLPKENATYLLAVQTPSVTNMLNDTNYVTDYTFSEDYFVNMDEVPLLQMDFSICENITLREISHVFEDKVKAVVLAGVLSIFFITVIISVVIYSSRQLIQVWLYSKYGLRIHNPKEDEERRYDAFISHSDEDDLFVLRELAPHLEALDPPYRLCLQYRDWPVGSSIAETIIESVQQSKRTILLLTDNFVQSEWCHYEFQAAHHQVLKDKQNRLIIILVQDKPPKDLDPQLKLYIKSNTFLHWNDPWFWKKLMYALPNPRDVKRGGEQKGNGGSLPDLLQLSHI